MGNHGKINFEYLVLLMLFCVGVLVKQAVLRQKWRLRLMDEIYVVVFVLSVVDLASLLSQFDTWAILAGRSILL